MIETYTFRRCYPGGSSFARVELEFVSNGSHEGVQVLEAVDLPVDLDKGEFPPSASPDLFAAALSAMEAVARQATAVGISGDLRLRRLIGLVTDTHRDAVACAAGLAAMRLLLPSAPLPRISDERPWRLLPTEIA